MGKKQIQVFYTNKGLGNFYGNYIEINKQLKYNKPLRDYVIKHELGHKKEFDILHEFNIDWKIMPSLFWFVIKTPSTWIDFSPLYWRKKEIVYDLNLIILYSFIIIGIYILTKIF